MDSHLSKPFNRRGLLHAVEQAVDPARDTARPASQVSDAAGSTLMVFDARMFAETTSFLPTDKVASSLAAITTRMENLLTQSSEAVSPAALVPAAHSLAGSASLFGFLRASDAARQFEAAVSGGDAASIARSMARLRGDLAETLAKARAMLADNGDPGAEALSPAVAARAS